MTRAICYQLTGHGRSTTICTAMAAGIKACGDRVTITPASSYREPAHDVAVFYGMAGGLREVMADYVKAGKQAVYVDLGYWGREEGGRRSGYHKVTVNARHPTAYLHQREHSMARFERFRLDILPWHRGKHILLAGFSAKHAIFDGYEPHAWERKVVAALRLHTDRPIVYRPKPSDRAAHPLAGVLYSAPSQSLREVLANAHAVVTHHSNVGVDGLLAGVPVFTQEGAALTMGLSDWAQIEQPVYPDGRAWWAADVAHCQFSVAEMAAGVPWRHFKEEGLIS